MKVETRDALKHARIKLDEAVRIIAIEIYDVAGRQAYLAAVNAASGLIFELRDKHPKTQAGVRATMHELVRNGLAIDLRLREVFDKGYKLKRAADYGDESTITDADARQTIQIATDLVERIEAILADGY